MSEAPQSPEAALMEKVVTARKAFEEEWDSVWESSRGYDAPTMVIEDLDDASELLDKWAEAVNEAQQGSSNRKRLVELREESRMVQHYEDEYRMHQIGEGEDRGYQGLPSKHEDEDGNYIDPLA